MAIEPKIHIGHTNEKRYSANKKFTDRTVYKDIFWNEVNSIKSESSQNISQYHILNFYGIGGIGKSSLQKELCHIIDVNHSDIIYSCTDFANISNHTSAKLLLELAKSFERDGIMFYHFGLAYAIYFQKTHKDLTLNYSDYNVIDENIGFIAEILSVIDGLGIIGILPGMVNKIYSAAYKKLHLNTELKDDLKKMELLDISRCEQLLPAFFAYDLKKYMQKESDKVIIIFLDTYEALWGQLKNDITKFSQDQFVRELVSQLPGVLFTICGREFLDWTTLDSDWNNYLKQYLIEKLEDNDADTFLKECGINEIDIRKRMVSVSMGHPYQLDLLVDTYMEMKNKNITPQANLFANNAREILACFFRYLQAEEIAVINILSIPRFYDFMLFKYLLLHFPTGYPVTMFEDFNKFSFVSKMDNDTYHIHEIMRKDLLETIAADLYKEVNKALCDYYFNLLQECNVYDRKKLIIKECIHHLKFYLSENDYVQYICDNFSEYFTNMQYRGESAYLYDVLSDIFSYIDYSQCVEIYEIYTDMIMLNGNFKEAVNNIDIFLQRYSINQISTTKNLLQLYVKKLKHQMVYISLNETINAITTIKPFVDKTSFPHQYAELLYTEGNMLFEKGDFEECKDIFGEVLEIADKYSFDDLKCRVLRKKTDYCLATEDVYSADENCRLGFEVAKTNDYTRYLNYIECSQAEIYRKLKLFEQSKQLYMECQKKFLELGIQPWIAHTELGLAMIELEVGNYSLVTNHLEIANGIYVKYFHTWGKLHTDLICLECNYMQMGSINTDICNELKRKCRNLGYNYIIKEIEKLEHDEFSTANLRFL